jgi:hypothetical protein
MMRAALALLLAAALQGCAGTASYAVRPFYEPTAKQFVCCEAVATNSKDIATLTFDLSMQPGGAVTVHFTESGVGATAPITAQGQVTTAVAGAVSNAAAAAIKLTK